MIGTDVEIISFNCILQRASVFYMSHPFLYRRVYSYVENISAHLCICDSCVLLHGYFVPIFEDRDTVLASSTRNIVYPFGSFSDSVLVDIK